VFRVIFEIHRLPELTHEQFAECYRQHGPLPRAFPGVLRYTQCLVSGSQNLHGPEADAISILDFESEDDYRQGDEILNAMPTGETPGQRTSVDRYDVVFRMKS